MKKLTKQEIKEVLSELPDWKHTNDSISKRYSFETFSDALIFVNQLGEYAEEVGHHPDMCVGWGYCTITLTTHDIGGVSSKDLSFAKEAEALFVPKER